MLADAHIRAWATCGQTRTRFKHFCKKKRKKTIPLYCFDERKLQNSEGKGKMLSKVSLHMYSLILCAIDEVGKINRLPR